MEHTLSLTLPRFRVPRLITNLRASIGLALAACVLSVTTGCTTASVKSAVQQIANDIPTVQTYIATGASVAETLDPAAAVIITTANNLVQTSLTELQVLLNAYAQSPSATTWASIVDAVNTIINTNAAQLLDATHIVDPNSRAKAIQVLGALQTALLLIYSIIQNVADKVTQAKVAAQAQARVVKVSQIAPYLDHHQVEEATGTPFGVAIAYETSHGF